MVKEIISLYFLKEVKECFNQVERLIKDEYVDKNAIDDLLIYLDNKTIELKEKHVGVCDSYHKMFTESDLSEFEYYLLNYIYPELIEKIEIYDKMILNKFKNKSLYNS